MPKSQEELLQEIVENTRYGRSSIGNTGGGGGGIPTDLLARGANKVTDGLAALASGTATNRDVLGSSTEFLRQFNFIGDVAGNALGKFGNLVLDVNDTMRRTSGVGFTLGMDLGKYNEAVMKGQLTMNEFNDVMNQNSKSLTSLGGGMDSAGSAFLDVLKDIQTSNLGIELKTAGMQSTEFANALSITAMSTYAANMKDVDSRRKVFESAAMMSDEMDRVARITGISRKEQEANIRRQMEDARVQAAIALKGNDFGQALLASKTSLGEFGPTVQRFLDVMATGGPRTADDRKIAATLGAAAVGSMRSLAAAMESGDKEMQAAALARTKEAIHAQVSSENFQRTAMLLNDSVYAHGTILTETNAREKANMAERMEIANRTNKSWRDISEADAEASLNAKISASRGYTKDDAGNKVSTEGAKLAHTLSLTEQAMKVAGGNLAGNFTKINVEVGNMLKNMPELNKMLSSMSTNAGMQTYIKETTDKIAANLNANIVKTNDAKVNEIVRAGPDALLEGKVQNKAPATNDTSINNPQLNTVLSQIAQNTATTAELLARLKTDNALGR